MVLRCNVPTFTVDKSNPLYSELHPSIIMTHNSSSGKGLGLTKPLESASTTKEAP